MNNTHHEVKSLSDNDPLESLLQKIVVVHPKGKGRNFSALFIGIRNERELWFENKRGMKWMTCRDDIREIHERNPRIYIEPEER